MKYSTIYYGRHGLSSVFFKAMASERRWQYLAPITSPHSVKNKHGQTPKKNPAKNRPKGSPTNYCRKISSLTSNLPSQKQASYASPKSTPSNPIKPWHLLAPFGSSTPRPESTEGYHRRIKANRSEKTCFTEGWVEFED